MKRIILALSMVLVLCMVMAIPAFANGPNNNVTGRQNWQLDSENVSPGAFQMEKNSGPGDNGQTGQVFIPAGASVIWQADQVALANVTFSGGIWVVELKTEADWGVMASACQVEIGEMVAGIFVPFTNTATMQYSYDISPVGLVTDKIQIGATTVGVGNYLAIRVTNNDLRTSASGGHIVYTGIDLNASCVSSPQTDPGYPLPELATGILLAAGILGLGGFMIIRRRKASSLVA